MGSKYSKNKESKIRSKTIDKQLKLENIETANKIKLLLLGAGDSGKSTIVKQMRILHENGFTSDERLSFRSLVFSNTIQSLKTLAIAMSKLKIRLDNQDRLNDVLKLFDMSDEIEEITPELKDIMKMLWNDRGVKECYSRSREFQLNDSAA